jgi:hypothetical protein
MADDLHWRALQEQLERGQLILFIGADLPQEITGLPSREDLARELAQRWDLDVGRDGISPLPLAEAAQRVGQAGNRFEFTDFICNALDTIDKLPQPFHQRVVELVKTHPIRTIITTAYDDLLERAFQGASVGVNRVVRGSDVSFIRPDHPTLIRFYGEARRPETLVVTEQDHSNLLRDRDREALVDEVCQAFRRNTVLFIGYNLADPDFRFLFDQVAESCFARTAYAVWPGLPEADVQMWRDRNVVILSGDPFGIVVSPPASPEPDVPVAPESLPLPGLLPQVNAPPHIVLTEQEKALIQRVHPGCGKVLVEKEFGGGYSGTRVLLTLPVAADGRRAARKVTKLGPASALRKERDNYERYVGRDLPFSVAQVKEYHEQADQAALNYAFVGGGALGQAVSLEEYYHTRTVDEVIATLDGLLDRELGPIWYGQSQPLNRFFSDEYGRHLPKRERLKRIAAAFIGLASVDSDQIQLPGVAGEYPNPLKMYTRILDKTLEGRRSYVHGDLHLRNVLVDESGVGRLIDFAKVEERHNLFDFIKLETYVRLVELARESLDFSLDDYVRFEDSLDTATLGGDMVLPDDLDLQFAHQIIQTIREIARKYMGPAQNFESEYFPALLLYNLAVTKYYQKKDPQPARLAFATACVLGQYALGLDQPGHPVTFGGREKQRHLAKQETTPTGAHLGRREPPRGGETEESLEQLKGNGESPPSRIVLGTGNRWAVLVGVNEYDDQANYGRLPVCVKDVRAVREQLIAGGFDSARIRLLADDADKPTRAHVLAVLQAVANATATDDLLLFYYSGHGDECAGESYLVARDGQRLVLRDTAVPISRVKEIMEQASARAKVMVLDACHSGADVGGKGPKPMSDGFIRRVFEEAEGLAILASCKQGELSYEWRTRERSVFTHFLLEAVEGQADRDEKDFVTIQDVNRHVTDGVRLWASQHNLTQTPTLQCAVVGDIILTDRRRNKSQVP